MRAVIVTKSGQRLLRSISSGYRFSRAAGYHDSTVPNNHPYRKRVYFYDPDGNDWEFVQYFSNDPAKRNDYDLSDRE